MRDRVRGLSGVFVAGVLTLVPLVGFSLFPGAETPQFYVNVTSPEGASMEATREAAEFAEEVLLARHQVQSVFTSIGRDNPRIYYNVVPRRDNAAVGQLFVVLDEYDPDHTPGLQRKIDEQDARTVTAADRESDDVRYKSALWESQHSDVVR
ncbi:MAG: efflux RND transporter permease subunit, partial [Candidatus Hydrogenedentes bacterium]|nr:efflux RND transporter permease subunit [Candidatus Hydrogenedentota bacterium]